MKDLLTISDLSSEEIYALLDLARKIKADPDRFRSRLTHKTLALLFQKTSTRTRLSFESGMFQLGGRAIYLDWRTTNIHLGSLPDEIRCIELYVDAILARVYEHKSLEIMREAASIPIINGLSNKFHPCQVLSDLLTMKEIFQDFDSLNVAWVGDGNNVCNSLILGCAQLNIPIHVATPPGYEPHKDVIEWVKSHNKSQYLKISQDLKSAVKESDIIYTDTFVSMGQEDETQERMKIFQSFQVNHQLITESTKDPYIMHCLPAHRGIEITDDVLDSEKSVVFQQAENRLHMQKAILLTLLETR
ncbi:MAG: ornithine carbamoyltransferase [Candidatus Lokiarchaeota archaeon]|nr:ornithine carbamoyltransferase [Candidatus Lokiarchaeota archaeon]